MSTNKLPSQSDDVPAWYVEVVKRAELAEHGPAKGAKTKAPIRLLPLEVTDPGAACMQCGKPGVDVATWARAY